MKTQTITWKPISEPPSAPNGLYKSSYEILIYDASFDDTVLGFYRQEQKNDIRWFDSQTGEELPNPTLWAKKPYPVGE